MQDPTLKVSVPGVRIDVVTIVAAGLSAILIIGVGKIVAMSHPDHPISQGFNVLF